MNDERLQHINFIMDDLYDSATEIYESLVDKEFEELDAALDELIGKLQQMKESIEDE